MGEEDYGIDPKVINRIAAEIHQIRQLGVQIGIVIGGGNIFRGAGLAKSGIDRVTGDHMGMLATVMNSLALQNAIEKQGSKARVMSAIPIHEVCEDYIRRRAIRHLQKDNITIFAAGIGNPFFTTDSAASLRAIEINAELVIKATKVDGVYSADPVTNPDAYKYDTLTYDEVIEQKLAVMDTAAVVLCRDQNMPIRIFNMS
ncbi:Uridine monophosphate kinase, partial [hydrothermal vent metagenome]